MKWSKGVRFDHPVDHLVVNNHTIVATVRYPSPNAYIPFYHYECAQPNCGDNLSSEDKSRLKKIARRHQRNVHGEE